MMLLPWCDVSVGRGQLRRETTNKSRSGTVQGVKRARFRGSTTLDAASRWLRMRVVSSGAVRRIVMVGIEEDRNRRSQKSKAALAGLFFETYNPNSQRLRRSIRNFLARPLLDDLNASLDEFNARAVLNWLEHWTVDPEVAGSSPVGLAEISNRHFARKLSFSLLVAAQLLCDRS